MKSVLKKIWLIINNIIFKFNNPQIKISISANINTQFLKKLSSKKIKVILGKSTLDGNIEINEGVKFLDKIICKGDIKIGRYTSINGPNTFVLSQINSIEIGSFCSIAPNVRIQEYYHRYQRPTSYYINLHLLNGKVEEDIYSKGKIIIEDDVWVGSNVIILSGVKIGRGSIIGAGSIVTKDVEPYTIVGGNPAKFIKYRFKKETIKRLEESEWWTWSEKEIAIKKMFFKEIMR